MDTNCDIAEIFADALELVPEARSALVRERCAGNIDAANEVELLLREYEQAMPGEFLAKDALEIDAFGSPCYVLNGEVFWGQDRIELLDAALTSGRQAYRHDV